MNVSSTRLKLIELLLTRSPGSVDYLTNNSLGGPVALISRCPNQNMHFNNSEKLETLDKQLFKLVKSAYLTFDASKFKFSCSVSSMDSPAMTTHNRQLLFIN